MDTKERRNYWIFPVPGYKSKLEKIVSKNDSFKNMKSELRLIEGFADIKFKDKNGALYNIVVEREMPRYSIKLFHSEQADDKLVNSLKWSICEMCAGEACVDVYINGKGHGAIPLDYHNV